MKWLFIFLLPATVFGQIEWGEQEELPSPPPFYPFSLGGSYLNVANATFHTPDVKGEKIKYEQYDVNFTFTYPFSEICGMIFAAGWVGTEVNWKENPDFDETNFDYIDLTVGGFTKAFSKWTWTLTLSAFLDTAEFSLIDYALYQGLLWGKYNMQKDLELDFGFLLEAGLNKDKIWPILGFIYTPNKKLRIHAVYPIDMIVEYDVHDKVMLGAAIRILRNRHRVKNDEPSPRAVFQYQSWGGEFDIQYTPFKRFFARAFVGSTFGGALKIGNQDDKHATHFKFDPSAYAGVASVLSF